MKNDIQKKAFEDCHEIPTDAEWNAKIRVYRYKQYPCVDHPINENWESFQDGWNLCFEHSGDEQ